MRKLLFFVVLCLLPFATAMAQSDKTIVTGSIQSDVLIPSEINADMPEHFLTNTYANLRVNYRHLEGGIRFEYLDHPMPGFEPTFKGYGVSNIYLKLNYDKWDLTAGTFYEQFGSGFILRTYEERSLGIDNSLLGARLCLRPYKGISLKMLSGIQRAYWEFNSNSVVSGADAEFDIGEWVKGMADNGTHLTIGGSWVNKYEKDETIYHDATHIYNFPKFVNAWDARIRLQTHGFSLLGEYARKGIDPNVKTEVPYLYRTGDVAMLSASYSRTGLSILLQAKRSDNMFFRSSRSDTRQYPLFLNHLPPFTMDHTYSLPALYPYATDPNGEWAFQGEIGYKFKKGTALGGKYGTSLKVHASYVRAIDVEQVGGAGTEGYKSKFFKFGDDTYYRDINVQFEKKFSKTFKLNLMYINLYYNMPAIEKHGDIVRANIFIGEGKFQLSRKTTLRAELQYLSTRDDKGDWAFGLLELSLAPHWMFTVSDQWNCGTTKEHYYQGSVTFNYNAHRLQVGYGRTSDGFNCTGGVCRYVPETKGLTLSYNYNF